MTHQRAMELNPCLHHTRSCLGPLEFLRAPHGLQISLSENGRRAERNRDTFENGLVFSSRSIRVSEKVHLCIERCDQHWTGALRVGFTSIRPSSSPHFPPAMAIPDLTNTTGYWAAAIPESHAEPGAELHYWVTQSGKLIYKAHDGKMYLLLQKVDVQKPLWAMIDVYGQTRAVLLLGSEKVSLFKSRRSCGPSLPLHPASPGDSCLCVNRAQPCRTPLDYKSPHLIAQRNTDRGLDSFEDCVVCLSAAANLTLPCGHRCLCLNCASRVVTEFRKCPLCRHPIVDGQG